MKTLPKNRFEVYNALTVVELYRVLRQKTNEEAAKEGVRKLVRSPGIGNLHRLYGLLEPYLRDDYKCFLSDAPTIEEVERLLSNTFGRVVTMEDFNLPGHGQLTTLVFDWLKKMPKPRKWVRDLFVAVENYERVVAPLKPEELWHFFAAERFDEVAGSEDPVVNAATRWWNRCCGDPEFVPTWKMFARGKDLFIFGKFDINKAIAELREQWKERKYREDFLPINANELILRGRGCDMWIQVTPELVAYANRYRNWFSISENLNRLDEVGDYCYEGRRAKKRYNMNVHPQVQIDVNERRREARMREIDICQERAQASYTLPDYTPLEMGMCENRSYDDLQLEAVPTKGALELVAKNLKNCAYSCIGEAVDGQCVLVYCTRNGQPEALGKIGLKNGLIKEDNWHQIAGVGNKRIEADVRAAYHAYLDEFKYRG
jgi:hypothetical protein